jgi:hypothetical protein
MKIFKNSIFFLMLSMGATCLPMSINSEIFNTANYQQIEREFEVAFEQEKTWQEKLTEFARDMRDYPFKNPWTFSFITSFSTGGAFLFKDHLLSIGSYAAPYALTAGKFVLKGLLSAITEQPKVVSSPPIVRAKPTLLQAIEHDVFGKPFPQAPSRVLSKAPSILPLKKINTKWLYCGIGFSVLVIAVWRWTQRYERQFSALVRRLKNEVQSYKNFFSENKNVRDLSTVPGQVQWVDVNSGYLVAPIKVFFNQHLTVVKTISDDFESLRKKVTTLPGLSDRCTRFATLSQNFYAELVIQRQRLNNIPVRW